MKAAKWLLGKFPSPVFRRPMRPLSTEQLTAIRQGLQAIGFTCPKKGDIPRFCESA
jgi:hypothetical protein